MKKSVHYSRILVSIALVFCMLFGLLGIVDAGTYTNTLYPLSSSSGRATRTVSPEQHTIKIYISGGKNGSSLKKDVLPDWITVKSYTDYYQATIKEHTNSSVRKGSIVFSKGSNKYELFVTQNPFLVKNSSNAVISSLSFKVAGETKTVTTTYDCNPPTGVPSWLKVTKDGNAYKITAQPNINGSKREFTLTFTKTLSQYVKVSRTVKVTQSANSLTEVPTSRNVSDEGSSFTFTVKTGYGTVSAKLANNYSWLHISQNGNKVTVTIDPNVMRYERSGKINITVGDIKKAFTITQKALQFNDTLQNNISSDTWSSTRASYLTKFYDGLYNGAGNTSNSVGTRYVVSRAKTITCFSWTPSSFAYGYRENSGDTARDFDKNHTYYGLPYQQTDQNGKNTSIYYHYGNVKTLAQFRSKVNDPDFGFGNRRTGKNGSGKDCYSLGPKCGIDCSSFVSYCIGATEQQSAVLLKNKAKTKYTNLTSTMNIQPGDILWRSGHVLLVASVVKNGSSIQGLVLLESRGRTTASGRNIHVFYNSADALSKMFGNKSISECRTILRNLIPNASENIGTVSDFINSFNAKHTLLKTSSLDITLEYTKAFY